MSLYMDDIALSSNDRPALSDAFVRVLEALEVANFELSPSKVCAPTARLHLFNCDLETGQTEVREDRIDKFNAEVRSQESVLAFDRYCETVGEGNG